MKEKLKQKKGITLIALVITIIVLLILAGVSIAMLTGQNGILTQANNATIQQSHGAVREGIALAYNEYQIEMNTANNTKLASTETVQIQGEEEKALASYSSFLDFLNSKGYIKEGTTEEIWSIANNDNVEISITKTNIPDDQNVGAVLLTVDKIIQSGTELLQTMQLTEEEYANMLLEKLRTMKDDEKESLFVELINISRGANFRDINEFIEDSYNQGEIGENSKDAFYETIGGKEKFDIVVREGIYATNYNLIGEYNGETGELQVYTITNPDGEKLNAYVATTNGNYTFKVEVGSKEYTKTVNVNEIGSEQRENKYSVENIEFGVIGLRDVNTNNCVTFSDAYIIYNDNIINISEYIRNDNEESWILRK